MFQHLEVIIRPRVGLDTPPRKPASKKHYDNRNTEFLAILV